MAKLPESSGNSPKLSELPGELILEILQYLTVTRGYFPVPEEETSRQTENAQRIAALHGLTLTCRRLNSIVTPYLYESITKLGRSTDWSNVGSLLNTIERKPEVLELVRYIETGGTAFDGALGPSLETKLGGLTTINYDLYNWKGMPDPCLPCTIVISTLIRLAPNLQGLAIEESWHWGAIYDLYANLALRDVFLKNVDDNGIIIHISGSSATRFSPAVLLLSKIGHGQVEAGGILLENLWKSRHHPMGDFRGTPVHWEELQLVPVECIALDGNVSHVDLENLLSSCTFLRRFHCKWTAGNEGVPGAAIDLQELRKSLERFEPSLESLILDTLGSSWLVELDQDIPTIGSLREFTYLKHVEVSGMVLWNDDDDDAITQRRLSSILPSALETLVINVEWDDYVVQALLDLAVDCAEQLPSLKRIDCSWRPASMFTGHELIGDFERVGVELRLDVASCTEEEEKRIEADLIRMEHLIEYMDRSTEALAEEMRQEMTRFEEMRSSEGETDVSDATQVA
ncbi:hypothetical protein PSPO01_14527 [Paraphaeosphaeria sporulosa]